MKNQNALESAISQPEWYVDHDYLHSFPEGMAVAYLFFLSKAHAFNDGNKRAALWSCLEFFNLNNIWLDLDWTQLVELTVGVASGEISRQEAKQFFVDRSEIYPTINRITLDRFKDAFAALATR